MLAQRQGRGGEDRAGTVCCRSQATEGGGCGSGSSRAEHHLLPKLALRDSWAPARPRVVGELLGQTVFIL